MECVVSLDVSEKVARDAAEQDLELTAGFVRVPRHRLRLRRRRRGLRDVYSFFGDRFRGAALLERRPEARRVEDPFLVVARR